MVVMLDEEITKEEINILLGLRWEGLDAFVKKLDQKYVQEYNRDLENKTKLKKILGEKIKWRDNLQIMAGIVQLVGLVIEIFVVAVNKDPKPKTSV